MLAARRVNVVRAAATSRMQHDHSIMDRQGQCGDGVFRRILFVGNLYQKDSEKSFLFL